MNYLNCHLKNIATVLHVPDKVKYSNVLKNKTCPAIIIQLKKPDQDNSKEKSDLFSLRSKMLEMVVL